MESQLWTSNFFHCSHLYPTEVTFINITDCYAYFEKKIYLKALLHFTLFHSRFFLLFPYFLAFFIFCLVSTCVFDTNMLVSKTRVKTREKHEKI